MAAFHQFTPAQLYARVAHSQQEAATDENPGNDAPPAPNEPPCPELLRLLAESLYRHGLLTLKFHARRLGIAPEELRHVMKPLTGMSYTRFSEAFILLRIQEVLGNNVPWGTLATKAEQLGFSTSGLYRFMQRHLKKTPTGRTWYR